MFPQLVAGPIVRYSTVASELNSRRVTADDWGEVVTRYPYGNVGMDHLLSRETDV